MRTYEWFAMVVSVGSLPGCPFSVSFVVKLYFSPCLYPSRRETASRAHSIACATNEVKVSFRDNLKTSDLSLFLLISPH